ncbi:MAG: hypothetical protein ACFCUX_07185 [Candidatus Methylacidiphilales bacterium]
MLPVNIRVFSIPVPLVLLLLAACATPSHRSASGTRIATADLIQAQNLAVERGIPETLRRDFVALHSEGRQNSVLHAMRLGMGAWRLGRLDLAREAWDRAISEVEALQEGTRQAERSKSKFVGEREKWFKGESHERAALYLYRGLLYLQEGDAGNASACFKRAQIQDITGDDQPGFSGDWFSAEWALALASILQGFPEDAEVARRRATAFSTAGEPHPWPEPPFYGLIVVEAGSAPAKRRAGQYGEKLIYSDWPTRVDRVRLVGSPSLETARSEDLYLQATTRGRRVVDHILDGKASFKEDTAVATLGLFGAAAVASQREETGIAAGVLALAALGTAIASSATNPEADIRAWDNLPHSVFLIAPTVPDPWVIEALDRSGQVMNQVRVDGVKNGQATADAKKLPVALVRFSE